MPDDIGELDERIRQRLRLSTWKAGVGLRAPCDGCSRFLTLSGDEGDYQSAVFALVSPDPEKLYIRHFCVPCFARRLRAEAMDYFEREIDAGRLIKNYRFNYLRCVFCAQQLFLNGFASCSLDPLIEYVTRHRDCRSKEDMRGRLSIVAGEGAELSLIELESGIALSEG